MARSIMMQGVGKNITGGTAVHFVPCVPLMIQLLPKGEEIKSKFRRIAPKPAPPSNTNTQKINLDKDFDGSSCSKIAPNTRNRNNKQAAAPDRQQKQFAGGSSKKRRHRGLTQFLQPGAPSRTSFSISSSKASQVKARKTTNTELCASISYHTSHDVISLESHIGVDVYPVYNFQAQSSTPKVLTAAIDTTRSMSGDPLIAPFGDESALKANYIGLTQAEESGGSDRAAFRSKCYYNELRNSGSTERAKPMVIFSSNLPFAPCYITSPAQSFFNHVPALPFPEACRQKLAQETEKYGCTIEQQHALYSSSGIGETYNVRTLPLFPVQDTFRSTELQLDHSGRNGEQCCSSSETEFSHLTQLRLLPYAENTKC